MRHLDLEKLTEKQEQDLKLECVASNVADLPQANSTTDADTHPISDIVHTMVNFIILVASIN